MFGPEPALDFELEIGAFVAPGTSPGKPLALDAADGHTFGYCLVNNWSARGMQLFESAPLGPFLGKSFATTISPWIVTSEALAPYRVSAPLRDEGDPEPPHLTSAENGATRRARPRTARVSPHAGDAQKRDAGSAHRGNSVP